MRDFFRTLAPEQFDAKVTVLADASYSYSYAGILIFVPALVEACRAGRLSERLDAKLTAAAAQLRQEGFCRVEYLGRGRYAVTLQHTSYRREASYFPSREMPVLSIRPQNDGTIVISGSRPDSSAPCQLTGTDAEIDGELMVTLEKGVKALSHNAQIRLAAKDLSAAFIWRIKSPDDDPWIVVGPQAVARRVAA